MDSVVDEKRRITIPKHLADELGLRKGTTVSYHKDGDTLLVKKTRKGADSLEEVMSWNPRRVGRPERISEREMKDMWHQKTAA